MADIVDSITRKRLMSGIRSKHTCLELLVRRGLYGMGLRYRLHLTKLPGTPDIFISRHNVAVFVNGCFWHGHNCQLFKWPSSRADFWRKKIEANQARDRKNYAALKKAGFRVLTIWECSLRGRFRREDNELFGKISDWLDAEQPEMEIAGYERGPVRTHTGKARR